MKKMTIALAATAIRHEAEQQAQLKARATEAERARLLEDARAEAEALLQERIKRISELSDSLSESTEAIRAFNHHVRHDSRVVCSSPSAPL